MKKVKLCWQLAILALTEHWCKPTLAMRHYEAWWYIHENIECNTSLTFVVYSNGMYLWCEECSKIHHVLWCVSVRTDGMNNGREGTERGKWQTVMVYQGHWLDEVLSCLYSTHGACKQKKLQYHIHNLHLDHVDRSLRLCYSIQSFWFQVEYWKQQVSLYCVSSRERPWRHWWVRQRIYAVISILYASIPGLILKLCVR